MVLRAYRAPGELTPLAPRGRLAVAATLAVPGTGRPPRPSLKIEGKELRIVW